jgi:hypothetical protein
MKSRAGKLKNYRNVAIAPEWDDSDVFADWCDQQVGFNQIDDNGIYFELDKDIFSPFNAKIYSPETCCFVPKIINLQFTYTGKGQGKLFDGMTFNRFSETFQVQVNTPTGSKCLGNFYTELEAFYCLKEYRQNKLKSLAEQYRDRLDERVYDHLVSYDPEYPHSKEIGSRPVPLCVEFEATLGYYNEPLYRQPSFFFFEDGRSWRNNYNPYRRTEDVLL